MSAVATIHRAFDLADAFALADAEFRQAAKLLPASPSEEQVDRVIEFQRLCLDLGPWEPQQINRMCAALRHHLLNGGRF